MRSNDSSRFLIDLERLRKRARVLLIMHGVLTVASGGIVAFLTIVMLDWLFWLPPAVRIIGGMLFLIGFVLASYHWVAKPLAIRLTVPQIAGKVERHFGTFGDRLNSAVNFLEDATYRASPMMHKVVERVDEAMAHQNVNRVVTLRPVLIRLTVFVVGVGVLSGLVWRSSWWPALGLHRYAFPFSEVRWPRTVEIDRAFAQTVYVPVGESVELNLNILRGDQEYLRAVAYMRDVHGNQSARTMNRTSDSRFSAVIEGIASNLEVWFEAGDDDTRDRPVGIQTVRRPAAIEATVRIDPPDYARQAPSMVRDLRSGPIAPTIGSQLQFNIRSSKAQGPAEDDLREAFLAFESGEQVALRASPNDRSIFLAERVALNDEQFQIHLVDQHGFRDESTLSYRIRPQADRDPVVKIDRPTSFDDVTPQASLDLSISAMDDFGIRQLAVVARTPPRPEDTVIPIADLAEPSRSVDKVTVIGTHSWDLTPLGLSPGDRVTFWAEAVDNATGENVEPNVGRSSELEFRIISDADFEVQIRQDVAALGESTRKLLLEQEGVRDDSEVARPLAQGEEFSEAQMRQSLGRLKDREFSIVRKLNDLADRYEKIGDRVQHNSRSSVALKPFAVGSKEQARRLRSIASVPAEQAAAELRASQQAAERAERQASLDHLDTSLTRQQEVLDALAETLDQLDAGDGVSQLMLSAMTLLDRQQQLQQETRRVGQSTLGRRMEDLDAEERTTLQTLKRQQSQLADEARRMLQQAIEQLEQHASQDSEDDQAIQQAVEALRQGEADQEMDRAAEAISENRTVAAADAQSKAEQALQQTIEGLRERRQRQLEELRKRMERAEVVVASILADQTALRDATREAETLRAEPQVYQTQSTEQRRIRRNTRDLADTLRSDAESAEPARNLAEASNIMEQAAMNLLAPDPAGALDDQNEAIGVLEVALKQLRRGAAEAERERLLNSLRHVESRLRNVRAEQEGINGEADVLHRIFVDIGRLGRADNRRAVVLSGRQDLVRTSTDEIRSEIAEVPVYDFVLASVSQSMNEARRRFDERQFDEALIDDLNEIIRQMDQLLQAIDDTRKLPMPDEFAEGSGGSGGGSDASQGPPVPAVAELLVLKSMQLAINEDTAELAETTKESDMTESDLRRLRSIAERQQWVRDLTRQVTEKAREQ